MPPALPGAVGVLLGVKVVGDVVRGGTSLAGGRGVVRRRALTVESSAGGFRGM